MRLGRAHTNRRQHCFLRRRRRLLFLILESKKVIVAWTPSPTESGRDSATGCSVERLKVLHSWPLTESPTTTGSVGDSGGVKPVFLLCSCSINTGFQKPSWPKKSPRKKHVCMTTRPPCEGGRGGCCLEHLGTNYYFNLLTQISAPTSHARMCQ